MKPAKTQESPLLNLFINIFLPVIILNKGSDYLDPKYALLVALMIPLGYGIQDYVRNAHKNYVALLGLLNTALTGGLALASLTGVWFAVKEAALPLFLGILVLGSAWTKNPAVRMMFCNPQVMNMEAIESRLIAVHRTGDFHRLIMRTTLWLSVSFFISSALNFIVGYSIFTDIDPALTGAARDQVLNEQIARMTWMGFAVIALPLMLFSGTLIYIFLKRVSAMTDIPINSLLKS